MKLTQKQLKQLIKEALVEYRHDNGGAIGNVAAAVREAIINDAAQVAVQNNRAAAFAADVIRNMARVMERAEALGPAQLEALEAELSSLIDKAINIRQSAEVTIEP